MPTEKDLVQLAALNGLTEELDKLNNHLTALNALIENLTQAIKELTIPHPVQWTQSPQPANAVNFPPFKVSDMHVQQGSEVFECRYCGNLVTWPNDYQKGSHKPPMNPDGSEHHCRTPA